MSEVRTSIDKIANGEQKEKNGQRPEYDLPGDMQPHRADEHDRGE